MFGERLVVNLLLTGLKAFRLFGLFSFGSSSGETARPATYADGFMWTSVAVILGVGGVLVHHDPIFQATAMANMQQIYQAVHTQLPAFL